MKNFTTIETVQEAKKVFYNMLINLEYSENLDLPQTMLNAYITLEDVRENKILAEGLRQAAGVIERRHIGRTLTRNI